MVRCCRAPDAPKRFELATIRRPAPIAKPTGAAPAGTGRHLPQERARGVGLEPPCIERQNLIFPAGGDVGNRAVVREDKPNRFTAPWHKRQH